MAEEQIFDFHKMVSSVAQYFREKMKFDVKEHYVYQGMTVHVYGSKKSKKRARKGRT